MKSDKCPSCKAEDITLIKKMFAGSWFPIRCECGAELIPHGGFTIIYSLFEALLLLFVGFWFFLTFQFYIFILIIFIFFLILQIIKASIIPLVVKER